MKRFLLHTAIFSLLPLAGCVYVLLSEPDRKQLWLSAPEDCDNRGAYIYHRIFESEEPVDVAFLGSSHTINGIQDTAIAKIWSLWYDSDRFDSIVFDSTTYVANLGYCRFGPEMQFVIVKDLLAHKNPHTVVLEVNERFNLASHPMYPYYAETQDLISPASYLSQNAPANIYNGFLARLTVFRNKLYESTLPVYENLPTYGYRGNPDKADSTQLILPNTGDKFESSSWRNLETMYAQSWITATVELCRQHNARVFFLYIPSYHDQPRPVEGMDFYESLARVLIVAPEETRNKAFWRDPDHFNDEGAHFFSNEVFLKLVD